MVNVRNLAMHQVGSIYHPGSEYLTDGLVPKADTKQGNVTTEFSNNGFGDSSILRSTWPWRDEDAIGGNTCDIAQRNSVISVYDEFRA